MLETKMTLFAQQILIEHMPCACHGPTTEETDKFHAVPDKGAQSLTKDREVPFLSFKAVSCKLVRKMLRLCCYQHTKGRRGVEETQKNIQPH